MMKRYSLLIAVVAAAALWFVAPAQAQDAAATTNKANSQVQWHNGKWWCWQPGEQRWLVWNGSQWQANQPQARASRSYSYQGDSVTVGGPSYRPRSQSGRITNSFGIRPAGSKVNGNY